MMSTEVDESLSTTSTTVLFHRKPTCFNKITHEKQQEQKDQSTYISCSIFNNSIEETDDSQTYLAQMYPPIEACSGQDWY